MRRRAEAEERARRRHTAVTVTACVLFALVYVGVALYALPQLPDTMATHFGPSGEPDGFTPKLLALLLQGVAVVGVPAALIAVFSSGGWWRGENARAVSTVVVAVGAGLLALFAQIILAHTGSADTSEVRIGLQTMVIALGVTAAAAVVSYLLLPPSLPRLPSEPVVPTPVAPGERVSWFGQAHSAPAAMYVLGGGVLVVVVAAFSTGIWWLLLVAALMVLLMLGMFSFGVRIDAEGVAWRGALGLPRGAVGLDDIDSVSVIDVSPSDFGGMGLRVLPNRLGLITRSGPALLVDHKRGELVITVDDAGEAASVIEGLRLARPAAAARA